MANHGGLIHFPVVCVTEGRRDIQRFPTRQDRQESRSPYKFHFLGSLGASRILENLSSLQHNYPLICEYPKFALMLSIGYQVLYCRTVVVVEVQQVENRENRIFWCGFGFHQDFCLGTVLPHWVMTSAFECRGGEETLEAVSPKSIFLKKSISTEPRLIINRLT